MRVGKIDHLGKSLEAPAVDGTKLTPFCIYAPSWTASRRGEVEKEVEGGKKRAVFWGRDFQFVHLLDMSRVFDDT